MINFKVEKMNGLKLRKLNLFVITLFNFVGGNRMKLVAVWSLIFAAFFATDEKCLGAPIRVACVGDSITCGVGTEFPEWNSYAAQLQRMLGEAWIIGNFGNSGSTLLNKGDRPYQTQETFKNVLNFKPDVVLVMLGTNDTKPQNWIFKSEFIDDYKNLIGQLKALESKPKIFLCRPPWISKMRDDGIDEGRLEEQLELIDELAREEGLTVIDMHETLMHKESFIPDGVHPNTDGAGELAKTAYSVLVGKAWAGPIPDTFPSEWAGFHRVDFFVNGRSAILVAPKKNRAGNPWIWRTEFFGAFPSADVALLAEGYHVAYVDLQNLYGAPAALDAMDEFYSYLVHARGLSSKPVLEGFSRGGLFALNWAARNPSKVGALYLDAPVCDFKSWPGGKGKSGGSFEDWKRCLQVYGLTEEAALTYPLNPVDNLTGIAAAKIPIIAVAGDADEVVPMDENIKLVEKRYNELGGEIQLIVKPGIGHHPHSLEDPAPIVSFLLNHSTQ